MGEYAEAATRIETAADHVEAKMPEFAAVAREAAAIIRRCDKYSRR